MAQSRQRARPTRGQAGYSLVELVTVITITGIVALVPAQVLMDSMEVYADQAPRMDAAYQARLATERLKRDFRQLASRSSLSVMDADAISFQTLAGETVAYALDGAGELTRNGDLLAQGVSSLQLTYRDSAGAETVHAGLVNLLDIDLSVTIAGQVYRQREAAYPRQVGEVSGPLDEDGTVDTAEVSGNHWDMELISLSASDLVIDTFALSADRAMPNLKEIKIDNTKIFSDSSGEPLPTGTISPNSGDADDRTLPALTDTDARVKFKSAPTSGDSLITLVLNFTDGSSATLEFPLSW